ncbi:hypothetical protein [Streptomyces sp. NPDC002889]|uniref:hypothetical protein n=1 Tax=Streptomyces sp. NPDC002889 TaxID=3364669 RepID=UPI0036C16B18
MYAEEALLRTRALRAALTHRTDALDGTKPLELMPDGEHVTAAMLADHFEVDAVALRRAVRKHAGELGGCGYRRLQGEELRGFLAVNMPGAMAARRQLGVFTRQAVLVLAMLLRGSEVARRVRQRLLGSVCAQGLLSASAQAEGDPSEQAMFLAIGTPEQIADVLRRGL